MTHQLSLYDGIEPGACPTCRGPVVDLEIPESGRCTRCGIAVIRGSPSEGWNTFANYFDVQQPTAKAKRRKAA